jgi:hypothetical protein
MVADLNRALTFAVVACRKIVAARGQDSHRGKRGRHGAACALDRRIHPGGQLCAAAGSMIW